MVALLSLGAGAVLDSVLGPQAGKEGSGHALFHTALPHITEGDILLGDHYYCSYAMIAMLRARGADVVFQQYHRRHTDFRKGQQLGTLDHVVVWNKSVVKPHWLSDKHFDGLPETMWLREVRVGPKVLVSTLLSPAEAGVRDLKSLYAQRWNVELDLRNIKSTLGLDRLVCKTPSMNEKRQCVGLLVYNLIRLLILRSAKLADVLPRQLSFKDSLQLWLAWSQRGLPPDET